MSSDSLAIVADGLSKHYRIYANPKDRFKQAILPRLDRLLNRAPRRYFHEFKAVEDVSFSIRRGETVGIIGRNGSGKSTLLQMLAGTLTPSAGQVRIAGRVAPLLELGAGFNPDFTGRENVLLSARLFGLKEEDLETRYDAIVAFADIGDFINQPVKTYSSGMFVRLAFAVIAHVDADVLVIDEALSVGDAFFVQKCMRFLRDFMKRGTVVFVSHDTAAVNNLCDQVIWLRDGRIAGHGAPKEITAQYLEDLYGADEVSTIEPVEAPVTANSLRGASAPRDMRQDLIDASPFRNDIELFHFSQEGRAFGAGGAEIRHAAFVDEDGRPLAWVVGGQEVALEVTCHANRRIEGAIVGFEVYDRLGQTIFGDNTYLTTRHSKVCVAPGDSLVARFDFRMPVLREGDYTMSVAIAEGSQADHVQHHWIHEALAFHVHTTSICIGLMGVPMRNIELRAVRLT